MVYIGESINNSIIGMVKSIQCKIREDLANWKNFEICLNAYNFYQNEERGGIGYIFNIDNQDDLKYLVENGMITAKGILLVMSQESHYFMFDGDTDKGFIMFSRDELIEMLGNCATDYMYYAMLYVGRCGEDSPYAIIYDEYIPRNVEDYLDIFH